MLSSSGKTPDEKKALRKKGSEMIKQLLELFPEKEPAELAEAIKQFNFQVEAVVNHLLTKPKPAPRPTPKAEPPKPTPKTASLAPAPVAKFTKEISRIRDVVPDAPTKQIEELLTKFKADEEKVILYLLENGIDEEAKETEPEAAKSEEQWIKNGGSSDSESFKSWDGSFDECDDVEEAWDDETDDWKDYKWDEDEELKSWFGEIREQDEKKPTKDSRPDMITQLYQEIADEEYARRLSQEPGFEFATPSKGEVPKKEEKEVVSPQAQARKAKRFRDYHIQKLGGGQSVAIEPTTELQDFMEYVQEAEFRALTNPVQPPRVESLVTTPLQQSIYSLRLKKTAFLNQLITRMGTKPEPFVPLKPQASFIAVPDVDALTASSSPVTAESEALFRDEFKNLTVFFKDRITISHSYPKRLSIRISTIDYSKGNHYPEDLGLVIFVVYGKTLDTLPRFLVRSMKLESLLSPEVLTTLEAFVNKKARHLQSLGTPIVAGAIVAAELWLSVSPEVAELLYQSKIALQRKRLLAGNPPGLALSSVLGSPFTALPAGPLFQERNAILSKLNAAYPDISLPTLTQLLTHYNWNTNNLRKACNSSIKDGTFKELVADCNLKPQSDDAEWSAQLPALTSREYDCPCCLDTYSIDEMVSLNCRHFYCVECMTQFIELKIQEGGGHTDVCCPGFECTQLFDEVLIGSLVSPTVYQQYNTLLTNNFVSENPFIKWCPSGKCDYAIRITNQSKGEVLCDCGHIWCWSCRQEGHWPCTCDQQKWWADVYTRDEGKLVFQSLDEAETVKWLLYYTQDCPKCSSPIEKSGGCNHMSCRKCGYQYCWICQDPWSGSHYNCKNKSDSSHDRADEIAKRIDTNLTFRQMYIIQLRAKKETDVHASEDVIKFIGQLVTLPTTTFEDIEVLFLALETILVTRHTLLKLCILGKFLQEHKLAGSNPLKKEIRRLGTQINFTQSCLEFTGPKSAKSFNREDVTDALTGIKSCFMQFLASFNSILKSFRAVGR